MQALAGMPVHCPPENGYAIYRKDADGSVYAMTLMLRDQSGEMVLFIADEQRAADIAMEARKEGYGIHGYGQTSYEDIREIAEINPHVNGVYWLDLDGEPHKTYLR